jgi:hypothetical protein
MVNMFDPANPLNTNMFASFSQNQVMIQILICSTQLGANYDLWKDMDDIQNIVNIEKNSLCKMMKSCHPYLDDKSVKCIVLSMYIYMFREIANIV